MRRSLILLFLLSTVLVFAQTELPYEPVEGWAQFPEDYTPGAGMAVAVDPEGDIWYYNRGSHPVIELAPDGSVKQAWKEDPKLSNHAGSAHGMAIGADGGVWLVGRETATIFKLSPEGRKLVVIGSFSGRTGGDDAPYAFDRPASVAEDSAGNIYIADGYRNTRVAKYGPTGEYIQHWGGPGDGQGRFNLVHGVAVGPGDLIYVADRGNNRVQVFDADGKFLDMWEGFGTPWALTYDADSDAVWVVDGDNGRVLQFALDGRLLGGFGSDGQEPGQLHQVHGVAVGPDGAIYVAETVNQRIQKFVRK